MKGSFPMSKFLKRVTIKLLLVPFLVLSLATPAFASENTRNTRNNDYPIVLVHGFMGWGRDEAFGFKYWGGFNDIQENMKRSGYKVYTASVGPIASNWDRACELYAYIKGGRVDYGKVHSKKYGHLRYGKTFPGLYPEWGEKDQYGNIKKIHLIGHSMGGQTIRTLVQFLEQGSNEEVTGTNQNELSPLFKGNKSWVCSVTSISTPHDGTSILDYKNFAINTIVQKMLGTLASVTGNNKSFIYDFKADQWGLKRESGESYSKYVSKVLNSDIWNTKDIAKWDLSPQGAKELNEWVKAQPDVYYFSWTTKATKTLPITGRVIPDPIFMNPMLMPTAEIMTHHTNRGIDGIKIDSKWFPNDGAVNVISANGPKLGSHDKIVRYKFYELPKKGQWTDMGIIENTDHMDIVGIANIRNLNGFYNNIGKQLTSLQK
ncbi:lipase [Clostridium botulinum C/D str. BKT12695]|nr:lipase [Clostridium botulinum C/D str. BKT12695]